MRIDSCEFPDDVLYEPEGLVWAREDPPGEIVVGVTSIFAGLAGKLTTVKAKPVGAVYARDNVLGSLEGGRYFGVIRAPVGGTLVAVNEAVLARPKTLSEAPYGEGWFARLRPMNWRAERETLLQADAAAQALASQIAALHVRCFAAFPDYEMSEIGTECAAVLVKLNELLERIEIDEVVHLVSDDWTAPMEMERWSEERGQPVIESRREGSLYHFLVRKVH